LAAVEDILTRFWVPEGEGGDDEEQRQPLLDALEAHCRSRRGQNRMIIVGIVLVFLLVGAACSYDLSRNQLKLLPFVAPLGVGIAPLVTLLVASVSDLSKTALILRIAKLSDIAAIRALIDKVISK
jgi:hypothetical protein